MSEKLVRKMDSYEVDGHTKKVLLATDPFQYIAEMVDQLATAEDEPSDVAIAAEILDNIETDLQLVAHDTSLVLDARVEAIIQHGQYSDVGLRIIFSLFKEVGFQQAAMETALAVSAENPISQLHNLSVLKVLRETYADEA